MEGIRMSASTADGIGSTIDGLVEDLGVYRQVLGSFMTGVTVVTTVDADGRYRGITANSFTSVSLAPPLVLFCVDYRAASYETFQRAEGFVVHILSSEQQELAKTFASKSETKFDGVDVSPGYGGSPILDNVHAWLECKFHDAVIAGDHAIIIGEVVRYRAEPARPLGFYQGRFFGFNTDHEIAALVPPATELRVSWMMQNDEGSVIARIDGEGFALPSSTARPREIHVSALSTRASELFGRTASVEFLYSVYEDDTERLTLTYRGQVHASDAELAESGFVCLPPADIDFTRFARSGEEAVVQRYLDELAGDRFGVYAGTLVEGSIARIGEIAADARPVPARAGKE